MNNGFTFLIALLFASQSMACVADGLVVYPPVPGLAASAHYKVRVRSASDGAGWRNAFTWETSCKTVEKKTDAYFDTLAGWTHSYVNFETAGAVEIQIARANGEPIRSAAVHPKRKASACSVKDGKAYVRLDKPCLVAVDIDGQMDGQDTGRLPFQTMIAARRCGSAGPGNNHTTSMKLIRYFPSACAALMSAATAGGGPVLLPE